MCLVPYLFQCCRAVLKRDIHVFYFQTFERIPLCTYVLLQQGGGVGTAADSSSLPNTSQGKMPRLVPGIGCAHCQIEDQDDCKIVQTLQCDNSTEGVLAVTLHSEKSLEVRTAGKTCDKV